MKNILTIALVLCMYAASGQQMQLMLPIGHSASVEQSVFLNGDKYLITASADGTVKKWETATGHVVQNTIVSTKTIDKFIINEKSGRFITLYDHVVKIWDTETGELVWQIKDSSQIEHIWFSPDGDYLVTGGGYGDLCLWDLKRKIPKTRISDSVITPDGFMPFSRDYEIQVASDASYLIIYDRRKLMRIDINESGNRLLWMDSCYALLKGNDNYDDIYHGNLDLNESNHQIVTVEQAIRFYGKTKVSNSLTVETLHRSYIVKVWSAINGNLIRSFEQGNGEFLTRTQIKTVDDSLILLPAKDGFSGDIWNLNNASKIAALQGRFGRISDIHFSKDKKKLLTLSEDDAKIWDVNTGILIDSFGSDQILYHSAISGDGKIIVAGCYENGRSIIWHTGQSSPFHELSNHVQVVNEIFKLPEMEKVKNYPICLRMKDDNKLFWAALGICNLSIPQENFLKFFALPDDFYSSQDLTPDRSMYVETTDTTLSLISIKNEEKIITHIHQSDGATVTVSSDNSYAAINSISSYDDHWSGKLYDIKHDSLIQIFGSDDALDYYSELPADTLKKHIHILAINSMRFSSDNKAVITASKDGTVKIWDVPSGKLEHDLELKTSVTDAIFIDYAKQFILATEKNGQNSLWDLKNNKKVYDFALVDSFDNITIIPGGYFLSSKGSAKLLYYLHNGSTIGFDQLDVRFNRPDKVLDILGSIFGNTDTSRVNSYRLAYYKRIKKLGIDTTAFTDSYTVPEADFVNRDSVEYEQTNNQVKLHIAGADTAITLDRFNIWVNESPLFGVRGFNIKGRKTHNIDTTITIILSQGKNTIETSVTNVNATESYRKPLVVNYTPANGVTENVYFVGIGMDHFRDSSNNLQWSVKDIRDEARALKKKFGERCIIIDTLFNERVTTANVLALKKKLQQTTVNDKVIIAYSGHGLFSKDYDYYLSTYDINFSNPAEKGLPYDELENLLDSIPARKKLMLLDACHSGEVDKDELVRIADSEGGLAKKGVRGLKIAYDTAGRKLGMKNSFELMQSLFVNVGRNTGAVVISAAGGTQFAYEKGELGNGVFTHCVLEEMNTDHLAVSKLQADVSAKVSELTAGLQVPTARSETKEVDWEVW